MLDASTYSEIRRPAPEKTETGFPIHDHGSAPVEARQDLKETEARFGFLPHVHGVLAESPAALKGFVAMSEAMERSSLTAQEAQLTMLAISVTNDCGYCVAGHSTQGEALGLPRSIVQAVREDLVITDPKLQALRRFAQVTAETGGQVSPRDLQRFFEAGYTKAQALDVIMAVALKTLSNTANHLAETPLDEVLVPQTWTRVAL